MSRQPALDVIDRCAPYARLVHDFPTGEGYVQPPRVINDHGLLFMRAGTGEFFAGEERIAIQPHRLFLIPPGAPHRFTSSPGTRLHMLNIHFDPVMRPDSRSLYLYFSQTLRRRADEGSLEIFPGPHPRRIQTMDLGGSADYAHRFHAVREHFPAQDRIGSLRARAAMLELLAWLHALGDAPTSTGGDAIERARDLIRQRFAEPLSLAGIAAEVGVGRTTLAVEFKRRFGVSPMAYLRSIRIEHARVLLSAEGLPPKAAAGRVGFSSIHHFTRTFARLVGMPPGAYRRGRVAAPS
jgi:AraC-like DNA-binding protein